MELVQKPWVQCIFGRIFHPGFCSIWNFSCYTELDVDCRIILVKPCLAKITKLCIELIGVIACRDVWINWNFCLMLIHSIVEL